MQFIRKLILGWLFGSNKTLNEQPAVIAPLKEAVKPKNEVLTPMNELVMHTYQVCIYKTSDSNLFYWSDALNPNGIGPFLTSKEAYTNFVKSKQYRNHPAKILHFKPIKPAKILKFPTLID